MPLSGAVIRNALAAVGAVGKQIRSFDELAAGASDALRQAPPGLTPAGAASFLATCAQESAYFRTTQEYGSGQRYAPYIGRGFVQCTWRENYAAYGAWAHRRGLASAPDAFLRDPVALAAYGHAWSTAVWYFQSTNLWSWANAGDHRRVSQAVNGGRGRAGTSFTPNHWRERKAMFEAFLRAGDELLPTGTGPGGDWFDMATEEDLRRIIREESPGAVWHHPIPDWYTPADDAMPAFAALGWATTHAAHARDAARQATGVATRVESTGLTLLKELRAIASRVGELAARSPADLPPGGVGAPAGELGELVARLHDLEMRLRALESPLEGP